MKEKIWEFIRRGMMGSALGPLVLVIIYLILHRQGIIQTLTVNEVCLGFVSLSALAFIASGMNVIYQFERLPLMIAILIHGIVLYISYLATYLVNDWLEFGVTQILIFSAIFILGYLAIWAVIYTISRKNTKRINALLEKKYQP
jgi:hypothetical protein